MYPEPMKEDQMICEEPSCHRKATTVTEFGDTYLCKGHRIIADANYEWNACAMEAKKWFKENLGV